ncbi:Retrovirus-related Pol polyprotein [Nymphon striatum]|nr:Retrovirus-related Pol polyprotein [Nymphon striatum]
MLCDTGACISILPGSLFKPDDTRRRETVKSVSGHDIYCHGTVTCNVKIGPRQIIHKFRVAEIDQAYFGADLLRAVNAVIDFETKLMTIDGANINLVDESVANSHGLLGAVVGNDCTDYECHVVDKECQIDDQEFVCVDDGEHFAGIAGIGSEVMKDEDSFFEKNCVLFKRTGKGDVLVVPKSHRLRIIHELHDVKSAGHLGRRKVLEKAKERFYWPNMTKDIEDYLKKCHVCAVCKDTPVSCAPLKPVDISRFKPFQRLAMDIMGPIQPISENGNKFILVCQDYYTKWVEIKALPSTEANAMIKFLLDDVFSRYGVCSELVTDQGTQFMSREFQDFLCNLGIRHLKTSVYHPQSDLVERTNRTVINMIRSFIADDKMDDWDANLQNLAFAYRTSYHEGIGYSPFEVIHGWKASLPVDVYYAQLSLNEGISQSELLKKMVNVRKRIRETATSKVEKRAKDYNQSKNVKQIRELSENDLVYWKKPIIKAGISTKLQKKMDRSSEGESSPI